MRDQLVDSLIEGLMSSLLGVGLVVAILTIVVTAWLLTKTFELLVRVFLHYPQSRALWAAAGAVVLSASLVAATGGREPALDLLDGLSLVALVLVAKVVELAHDQKLQAPVSREAVLEQALHRPWWDLAAA